MKLPNIDELFELAQRNPEALESLRQEAINSLIASAGESNQKRLRGLQFQIDMERRRNKTPMAACMAISRMMHEQLSVMRTLLNDIREDDNNALVFNAHPQEEPVLADVLPFRAQQTAS